MNKITVVICITLAFISIVWANKFVNLEHTNLQLNLKIDQINENLSHEMVLLDSKLQVYTKLALEQQAQLLKYKSEINILKNDLGIRNVLKVTVTAYSPREEETDDTPLTTAFMKTVTPDTVAISRNIMYEHGWAPGDKIYIENIGIRTIGDLMNKRFKDRIDLFFWDTDEALSFGKHENVVVARLKI